MSIERWDIWVANFDASFGTEASKKRPVLVIQTDLLNKQHFSTIVLPITTKVVAGATILRFNLAHLSKQTGLNRNSDVVIDQLRAIDNRRFERKLGKIEDSIAQKAIRDQLNIVLDLQHV